MSDEPSRLEVLRDLQDREHPLGPGSFAEWRQEYRDHRALVKASGRAIAPGGFGPGTGLSGHLNTSSFAPTGPNARRGGMQGVGIGGYNTGGPPSRYASERPNQPTPWIDDVDLSHNWYSPFQPVWPFGPPSYTRPREWNFPVGYNLNYIPEQATLMQMLRGVRTSWGVLSTIIETRKDQLIRMPWTIQQIDKPKVKSRAVANLRKFFRRPDGILSYGQWTRKLLDDLFVIDAPTLYLDRSISGKLLSCEVHDGAMYFPLIDDAGRRPQSYINIDQSGLDYIQRQPAFQEIVYGLPMVNLSLDEVMYMPMHVRPELPVFGYSPVQQILIEATEAIRKTVYQTEFWRSGSMPELIITVPDNWTPRQIATFQGHFDALASGNLQIKSKVRFVPGGMKPFDIKNASGQSLWSERDELLVRLACYAFSVSPTPFVRQINRGTAVNSQQQAQEEGLYPLMSFWKDDVIDTIIQEKLGYDDCEFTFLPRPEVDQEKQAKILDMKIRNGSMTIDEARDADGNEPYPDDLGARPLVYTGAGAVPLELAVEGGALSPGTPPAATSGEGNRKPGETAPPSGAPMRGPVRPTAASPQPPAAKLAEYILKVSKKDVQQAAAESDGDIDRVSHLQQRVGNYKKGHIWIQGLNISIENEKGSKRGEKDQKGKKWQVKMPAPYGYIRGTIGADGMQVDVYIGNHPESPVVWVIDQDKVTPEGVNKGFDEHKVMLGYKKLKRAMRDYLKSHFDGHGHERIVAITELSIIDFKQWLKHGDMKEPISTQDVGEVVLRRSDLQKADTISVATNLSPYSYMRSKKKRKKSRAGPRWNLAAQLH